MSRAIYICVLLLAWAQVCESALPTFENRTPVGFSPQDSTTKADFVAGKEINVRVDLNQAATYEYPVVGHFHNLERSEQIGSVATDGMQVDIAMFDVVPFGTVGLTSSAVIHMAWIEETGTSQGSVYSGGSTPVYEVKYARSFDGGDTFSAPLSVTPTAGSGPVTYHPLTTGTDAAFSTLDLEVDSAGNPRVVYAFVSTADRARNKNVYFTYSQDGGANWNSPIVVNDDNTVGNIEGKNCAFPRMAINDRDDIFITYVRGLTSTVSLSDVMLAKVNRIPGTFEILPVGELGLTGTGRVRVAPDVNRHMGPDLAIGDGDALHIIYYNDTLDAIGHKRAATDTSWADVSASGWNQTLFGAPVAPFDNNPVTNPALEKGAIYYFPTIVVDRLRVPDRVYAVFKLGVDNSPGPANEAVGHNDYDDAGATGSAATWNSLRSAWSVAPSPLFIDGGGAYNIELDWEITERVSALVDDRLEDRGDLHIAFTAGFSGGGEHDVYYARYNGASWTLPEKVADDDSDGAGTEDGITNTDVFMLSPSIAQHPVSDNIYLAFAGGVEEGPGIGTVTNVNHHAYFKVLGRDITSEDDSSPVGGNEYTLSYTPVNAQSPVAEIANKPVYVHAADPTTGKGLGAQGADTDAFLAGDWEGLGTSLVTDNNKFFEGLIDEDPSSTNEWGDDDDKIGLLVKLNVLGSDPSTNLQIVNNSTASDAGTGQGSRSLRINIDPVFSTFVTGGSFFMLGADIDIVASNSAPTVDITDPDGIGDLANTSYFIHYDLEDSDDNMGLGEDLQASLYYYPSSGLKSVQDIRIFATLIADENDVSTVNSAGTNDFLEGPTQMYEWDDPPDALQSSALFASIFKAQSADYFIYLVADDGKNPPVFAVSPGPITVTHSPIVQQVDPIAADIVDTGVRTGLMANPYDLDFSVVDYDGEARVQLFYATVTGITSLSVAGVYPNQRFALGKSLSGIRGTAITDSTFLTTRDTEFAWDVTDSVCAATSCAPGDSVVVVEGGYYLYAVATDSTSVTVGNSAMVLTVTHSPSFVFFEPPQDTQREVDTGSQPVYAIQWQKGPGDQDRDDDATIDFYFTTDDLAVTDHSTESGASSTSLTSDPDTQLIVSGLKEDADAAADMYVWNFRHSDNAVPVSGDRVWLYAVITDGTNTSVVRGGSVVVTHSAYILLKTRLPDISQGDIVRLEWDDYLVDDAAGTDDAFIRLYASNASNRTTLQSLESNVVGEGGNDDTYIINSSNGQTDGTIVSIGENGTNAFNWDTRTGSFSFPQGNFAVYAGISSDATFSDNTTGQVSEASNLIVINTFSGSNANIALSPSKALTSVGDTLTLELLVQSGGLSADVINVFVDLGTSQFEILSPGAPFTDLGEVFIGGTEQENTSSGNTVEYAKRKTGGEIVGTTTDPLRLASFQLRVKSGFSGLKNLTFDDDETSFSIVGNSTPLKKSSGMSIRNAEVEALARGQISATVLLEGRSPPIGDGNHSTLLDVHLRLPGSISDIDESLYEASNDDDLATPDTVEVQTTSSEEFSLVDIPAGRYVLALKDTSHLSGRTDTLTIRAGETVILSSSQGLFASDVRGDASFLLDQSGQELQAGDVTEDNEIDEDDVNVIDAAWGTDAGAASFEQADLNNDGRVGVEDLTVTTVYSIGQGNILHTNLIIGDVAHGSDGTTRIVRVTEVGGMASMEERPVA